MRLYLLLILVALLFAGCTDKEQLASETLSLSLAHDAGQLSIVDYQVQEHAYKKSQQQGRYQAHIFDKEGKVLSKINFEKIEIPVADGESSQVDFYVSLPLISGADRVEIYQLDGSSGHYQLKTDDSMLNWPIPQDIRQRDGNNEQ